MDIQKVKKERTERVIREEGQVHILVIADYPGVEQPLPPDENGFVVIVLGPRPTPFLSLRDTEIEGSITVNQIPYDIKLPWESVVGIRGKDGLVYPCPSDHRLNVPTIQ